MRILVVEDDAVLADGLQRSLGQSDFAVDRVDNGAIADQVLKDTPYDLVVLDLGLPRLDGFEVLRRLRARHLTVPVLILSAREALEDRVKGLDLGADDYLVKPFSLPEFEARVRALLRRGQCGAPPQICYGALHFDTVTRTAQLKGKPLDLSAREVGVLEVLLNRFGRLVSKNQLVEELYNFDDEVGNNAIEVYIHRLRKKIEGSGLTIRTLRGLGYLLEKQDGV